MFRYLILIIAISSVAPAALAAEGRDPFLPFFSDTPKIEKKDTVEVKRVSPALSDSVMQALQSDSISRYRVVGTMISESNGSVTALATPDRRNYLVHVGDIIGEEQGVIEQISLQGITVRVEEKAIELLVNNPRVNDEK